MMPSDGLDTRVEGEGGGERSWAFGVSNCTPEMGETGAELVCAQQMHLELKSNEGGRGSQICPGLGHSCCLSRSL